MNHFSIEGPLSEWIVLFHGTGGNEYSLLQIAGDVNPNASILSFIGDVGEGANRRFFVPLLNGQLERADFDARIAQFLAHWKEVKPAQTKKITFVGYSNGANFILGLLEKQPQIADRFVLMHPSDLGYTFEGGVDTEIILTAGARDTLSVPGDTLRLAKQLEVTFPNTMMKLLDSGHEISEQEIVYLQGKLK